MKCAQSGRFDEPPGSRKANGPYFRTDGAGLTREPGLTGGADGTRLTREPSVAGRSDVDGHTRLGLDVGRVQRWRTFRQSIWGLLLVIVSILFVFGLINALLSNQQLMFQAVVAGLRLAFLWYLYSHLPAFLWRFLSGLFRRSNRDDHGH